MDLILITHCLFCWEQISPYSISDCGDEPENSCRDNKSRVPTFQKICGYLKIKTPEISHFKETSLTNFTTCDQFLCFGCFEMIEELEKLYCQVKEIQRKISSVTKKIQNGILSHDIISSNSKLGGNSDVNGNRNQAIGENQTRGGDEMNFTNLFRDLVKKSLTSQNKDEGEAQLLIDEANDLLIKTEINSDAEADENSWNNTSKDIQSHFSTSIEHWKEKANINVLKDSNDEESCSYQSSDHYTSKVSPLILKRRLRKRQVTGGISKCAKKQKISTNCGNDQLANFNAHPKTLVLVKPKDLNIPSKTILKSSKTGKRYYIRTCTICQAEIRARDGEFDGFMEHMLTHEEEILNNFTNDNQVHQCHLCEKNFSIKLNLSLHLLVIHQPPRARTLDCDICEKKCKSREDLMEHLKSHDEVSTFYSCKSCALSCSTLDNVLQHMYRHRFAQSLKCPICDLPFGKGMKELYDHCAMAHPDHKKRFECPSCVKKSYNMPSSLKQHLITHHYMKTEDAHALVYSRNPEIPVPKNIEELEINLSCPQCPSGKTYSTKQSLEIHISRMHMKRGNQYKCDHDNCQRSFTYRTDLERHIEKEHSGIMYPCPHCSKSYKLSESLTAHMRMHTGEGLFTCEHCGKQFPRMSQLKIHMEVHQELTETNGVVCETCGMKCKSSRSLQKHKKSHREKQLKCNVCQLMFRRHDALRSHMRVHTGERPYKCPKCQKTFNRRDILRVYEGSS